MKKIIASILAVGISIGCIASAGAANINMCVKDNYVTRDLQTLGYVDMLPILDISGELGLKTYFDGYTLWIEKDYKAYKFALNSANVYDGQGNWYGLDVTMRYINGKLYIPSSFLTNVLGISYSWDNITKTLYIDADRTLNWVKTTQEYMDAVNSRAVYANYISKNRYSWNKYAKFELGYLNNDDIPELFISEGEYPGSGVNIYTYKNGQMIKIDTIGSYGQIMYKKRTGQIYSIVLGNHGLDCDILYQLNDNTLDIVASVSFIFNPVTGNEEYKVNDVIVNKKMYIDSRYQYGFEDMRNEFEMIPNLEINNTNITNGIYNF